VLYDLQDRQALGSLTTIWCTFGDTWDKVFELVKKAEIKRFGEKSYFYRKINGLSLADFNDNSDLISDDIYTYNFKEPEEKGIDTVDEEAIKVDTNKA
jgi:hypothetical protein